MEDQELRNEIQEWIKRKMAIDRYETHKIGDPTVGGPLMLRSFRTVMRFLNEHGLVTDPIKVEQLRDDQLVLHYGMLNELGAEFMFLFYRKWLGRIDRGGNPDDATFLEKKLKSMQSNKA